MSIFGLFKRLPPSLTELVSFGFVGGLATLSYLVFFLLFKHWLNWPLAWLSVMAYGVGLIISYFGQSRLTFKNVNDGKKEVSRFLLSALLGVLLSVAFMDYGVETGLIPLWGGLLSICVLIPLLNFFLMKLWVFESG